MNKIRKTLALIFTALGISCLGALAACNAQPDYYKLTFQGSGVDFILKDRLEGFVSGGTVRKGVEVSFSVSVGSSAEGTPVIYLNGEEISADENGVYSFVIDRDSAVTSEGVGVMYNLSFSKFEREQNDEGEYVEQERRISYLTTDGKEITDDVKVRGGSSYSFKFKKSVYYTDDYSVLCNYDELVPDSNGVYTVENISANTTINVIGLTQADSFVQRGCGKGTKEEPYLLSEPIDLYYLAALTNSEFYAGTYYHAYYELAADIDLEGEQMFVVGDNSIETAVFCGEFDGKGHTISNFYVTDEVVDQETLQNEYLNYVGFFGFVAAQITKPAVIKNVNFENAELYMHSAAAKISAQTGGLLVGYGIGVEVSNCNVQGNIIVDSDNSYFAYAGGVVGVMQSAYNDNVEPTLTYDSFVKDCTSSVEISATGGVYAAGGIVAYAVSADVSAISSVLNCKTSGDVSGSFSAGGVVGRLGLYGSVENCSSTGGVRAMNSFLDNTLSNSDYYYAYGGGIVGFAENDTVIAYCSHSGGKVTSTASSGAEYAKSGNILGSKAADGSSAADTLAAVVVEGEIQSVVGEVTVNGVRHKVTPITHWYSEGVLSEYVDNAQGRSWGYYFDQGLTQKVPAGFVPLKDITLYCGYADYSKVAGEYSVTANGSSVSGKFTLTEDGVMNFRQGALSRSCAYTFDGEKITVIESALAALDYSDEQLNGARFNFVGPYEDGRIVLSGEVNTVSVSSDGSRVTSSDQVTYTAIKIIEDFGYGKYVCGGATYVFNRDGSAQYARGLASLSFSYKVSGGEILVYSESGDVLSGKVQNGKVTELNGESLTYAGENTVVDDGFVGSWFLPGMRERIELNLSSTAENGGEYGAASLYFAGGKIVEIDGAEYDVQTEGAVKYIFIYVEDRLYAQLAYDSVKDVLYGRCYSMHYSGFYNSTFYRYDGMSGTWNVSGGTYSKITFNGKGLYDESGVPATETSQEMLEVHGVMTAVTDGNVTIRGSYSLTGAAEGSAKIGGKTYSITIGEDAVTLTNTEDGSDVLTLTK